MSTIAIHKNIIEQQQQNAILELKFFFELPLSFHLPSVSSGLQPSSELQILSNEALGFPSENISPSIS